MRAVITDEAETTDTPSSLKEWTQTHPQMPLHIKQMHTDTWTPAGWCSHAVDLSDSVPPHTHIHTQPWPDDATFLFSSHQYFSWWDHTEIRRENSRSEEKAHTHVLYTVCVCVCEGQAPWGRTEGAHTADRTMLPSWLMDSEAFSPCALYSSILTFVQPQQVRHNLLKNVDHLQ